MNLHILSTLKKLYISGNREEKIRVMSELSIFNEIDKKASNSNYQTFLKVSNN